MKTINSFRSKLFALTLALMASVSTFAYDFQSGYLFYNILPDGTVAVTSETYGIPYDYLPNSLVIPSEVNGYNGETYVVTEIANYAFSGCSMLDTLVIPNTVKKIGMYAFTGCTKLVYISFPESIEDILGGALYECAWYNNQPDGLIYIGNLLYRYKGTAPTGTIVVKDGTKAILDFTFSNQPNIQSVVLPESVTSIHIQAFGDCPNLESVVLPSKLEAIEDHTFQYCEKLTNIKLPDALKLIGKNAFIGCTNLTKLTLPSSVQIIADEAFANCTSLTEVTCYATIPPVRGDVVSDSPSDWFFAGVDVAKIPLYVPTESIDLYKKAEQWMFFNPILPIEPTTDYKSQWCNEWNVMFSNGSVYPPSNMPYRYQLAKDTVIGEHTYTAVVCKAINDALDAPRYVAAVRFTDDRKVYIYYDNAEYLLYDFNVQEGDELEVFAGINNYRFGIKTYKCIVTGVEQYACIGCPATITLHVPNHPDDFTEIYRRTQWQEGVGDVYSGFLNGVNGYVPVDGGGSVHLLCAHKGDELKYTGPLYEEYGCGDDAEQSPEDLFPTLWGLQRTSCTKTIGEDEYGTVYGSRSTLMEIKQNMIIDGKQYVLFGDGQNYNSFLLREKGNKVFVYSSLLRKDLVLYDYTLEVGDSLPALYIDWQYHDAFHQPLPYNGEVVDYNEDYDGTILPADTFIVTNISTITLLDGKEHKKWTFDNGMEYIEGIGSFGTSYAWNDFYQLIANGPLYSDVHSQHLVCVSKNNKLLYQMDDAEMERLGAECLCEAENPEDLFPTLWGLQRTVCYEYCGETEEDNSANFTDKQTFDSIFFENDKPYILCNGYLLREEDNKIFLYSQSLNKDIVLYDFTLEVGDSLPAYIKDFDGTTYSDDTLVVTGISNVTLLDGKEYKKWTFDNGMEYVEGIGMYGGHRNGNFFGLIQEIVVPCHTGTHLVCVSKNGKLLYQMDDAEMERLGAECLCEAETPEDLFPTLWGLQRTTFYHYTECSDSYSSLTASNEIVTINDKPYLRFGKMFLREENNQVLIYSAAYDKDLVLYDWNLEVGDSISLLAMDYGVYPEYAVSVVDYRVIVDIDENGDLIMDTIPTDKVVVDKISTITLLDGKEYKTWHLATGWAGGITYVEGIGILSEGYGGGDYLGLIRPEELPTCYYGDLLVCVSKNNKLLYQMDPVKMDELGTECLCDYDRGPRKDNAKNGKIGGRPTPTQWNMLEVETKEMDGTPTILRAETFSYTLENDSIVTKGKTYYQLARQSTKDTATTKSVVGALHFGKAEDNRVYFLRDGVEYVLYDFTAEIGDTVEIFAGINNYPQETTYTHVVVDKDTTEDGACRMFLKVVFPDETTTATNAEKVWLAGLGSVDGIVHNAAKRTSNAHAAPSRSASSETQSSVMLCAWREDSCLYTTNHPEYDTFGCVYNQDPTAVEDLTSPSSYQKIIHEGTLLILHEGKVYNVIGIQIK